MGEYRPPPAVKKTHTWQMEHAPPYSLLHKEDRGLQYQLPSGVGEVLQKEEGCLSFN